MSDRTLNYQTMKGSSKTVYNVFNTFQHETERHMMITFIIVVYYHAYSATSTRTHTKLELAEKVIEEKRKTLVKCEHRYWR